MNDLLSRLAAVVGPGNVIADAAGLAPYLAEERGLFQGSAQAVLRPGSTDEVAAIVRLLAQEGVAIVPQGGNTGLCGGGVPAGGAVVVSTERLRRIRAVDPLGFTIAVEAGCVLAEVQQAALDQDRLLPLSLAAEGSCRIGGLVSTNAGGINVLRYGTTRDLVLGLEVVLADGRIWDGMRALKKDNAGYDLKQMFIGAEGTLGIVTAAILRLFPRPQATETALVAVAGPKEALELLALAREQSGDLVSACELIPRLGLEMVLAHIAGPRDPFAERHPWYVLIEWTSSSPAPLAPLIETVLAGAIEDGPALDAVLARSEAQRRDLWRIRESIPEAQKKEGASIKHDVSVPLTRVPELIERAGSRVAAALAGVRVVAFGHVGDGNIHFNLSQPIGADPAAFLGEWQRMNRIVHDIVLDLGGSISAEHGIGRLKTEELLRTKPALDIELMRKIKAALDPKGIMNPGKVAG